MTPMTTKICMTPALDPQQFFDNLGYSWKTNRKRSIVEEESCSRFSVRHLEGIWLGGILDASGQHLGSIREAFAETYLAGGADRGRMMGAHYFVVKKMLFANVLNFR